MLRHIICALLLIFSLPSFAQAQNEAIEVFSSAITVNRDASIDVSESINVRVTGDVIKHGIVRWLPIRYKDSEGYSHHLTYTIRKVLMNNVKTDYHVRIENNNYVIYIGNKDVFLTPGKYNYLIEYHVASALNFLRDGDELYWNVTGNNWTFPIELAQARIILPLGTSFSRYFAYTGPTGTQGKNFIVEKPEKQELIFKTNAPLPPGSGLTIAAAWPKGAINEPPWYYIYFDTNLLLISLITTIVFLYFCIMLVLHGLDPKRGTIIPLFAPPMNLSPAAMRYIMDMSFDVKALTAAIVSLATKGFIKIEYKDNVYQLTKLKDNSDGLPPEEFKVLDKLFGSQNEVVLSSTNYEKVSDAKYDLSHVLSENYKNKYFITNTNYFVPGALISLLGFVAAIVFSDDPSNTGFALVWLSVWTAVCYMLLAKLFYSIRLAFVEPGVVNIFSAVFFGAFTLPFLIGEVLGIYIFSQAIPIFTIPLLFLLVILDFIFYYLLKAPTVEGRKVMDQIEGFKMYLGTAEAYRLKEFNPPKATPEIFEKYLPYAIALNVEKQWGEQFNQCLKEAGVQPSTYQPTWYTGGNWSSGNIAAMPVILGSGIASSLSASSVSGSASSGSGSSGGGGGGGGGGSW